MVEGDRELKRVVEFLDDDQKLILTLLTLKAVAIELKTDCLVVEKGELFDSNPRPWSGFRDEDVPLVRV